MIKPIIVKIVAFQPLQGVRKEVCFCSETEVKKALKRKYQTKASFQGHLLFKLKNVLGEKIFVLDDELAKANENLHNS